MINVPAGLLLLDASVARVSPTPKFYRSMVSQLWLFGETEDEGWLQWPTCAVCLRDQLAADGRATK